MRLLIATLVFAGCAPSFEGEYRACVDYTDCVAGQSCVDGRGGAPRRCRAPCRRPEDCGDPRAACALDGFCERSCFADDPNAACPAGMTCAQLANVLVGVCVAP